MAENSDKDDKKKTLGTAKKRGTLSLKLPVGDGASTPRQSTSVGNRASSKPVAVEVKKKRGAAAEKEAAARDSLRLTDAERQARIRALEQAKNAPQAEKTAFQTKLVIKSHEVEEEEKPAPKKKVTNAETAREEELAQLRKINAEKDTERRKREVIAAAAATTTAKTPPAVPSDTPDSRRGHGRRTVYERDGAAPTPDNTKRPGGLSRYGQPRRRSGGKSTVTQILNEGEREGKGRSMAAQRRAREKQRLRMAGQQEQTKQFREVIVPEVISVQELANRMTERVGDVVKKLMSLGIMATGNQSIDADTAELIVHEFGHTLKRVSESDIEIGLHGEEDTDENLEHRPAVVTIMGHVDHGKTSLLDAIRQADVVKGEAGGITQHIGAYQITTKGGKKISFIDTPGHAAFTEMRARGADVTDIVILVVAADDSVMPQTIEAISHSLAAKKPIIIAINKCDLPAADPQKVRQELLQHNIVTEDMGGEIQYVEVSAITKQGLDQLEEAILLQAEVLHLRANPNRSAIASVIESRQEIGKGAVATVLVQNGTLKKGDIFVAGAEWGRVRALHNDRGENIKSAPPGQPVEVIGMGGTPEAGDDFIVVENDSRAREVAEFRARKKRALQSARAKTRGIDLMIQDIQAGEARMLPIIIKGDVHGSIEAIASSLNKLTEENPEVKVQIIHSAVGAITESDIALANASKAYIIAFNVRANPQARDMAKRDAIDIRYYSIIYEAIDDVKALLGGLLAPSIKENFIGYAEIRQIFSVPKAGKVAGCFITEGLVKRGAKVRLLRDNVVIHEGTLKTLRRFKEEVKEVKNGYECGMAFENYDDIKEKDVIEAFEMVETARTLADVEKKKADKK